MSIEEKKKEISEKMSKGFHPMMTSEQKKKMEKEKSKLSPLSDSNYYYPESIRFTTTQLPEIKKWEVGKEYQISLKVKMTAYEERKTEGSKGKEEGRFEVLAVKSDKSDK